MKDEFYYFKGRVTILVDTIPKYTQYQLSVNVK